jgi:hypothetical protein
MNGKVINKRNLRNLESIQEIITFEEGREIGFNDALERVLSFYRKFVPYD